MRIFATYSSIKRNEISFLDQEQTYLRVYVIDTNFGALRISAVLKFCFLPI